MGGLTDNKQWQDHGKKDTVVFQLGDPAWEVSQADSDKDQTAKRGVQLSLNANQQARTTINCYFLY